VVDTDGRNESLYVVQLDDGTHCEIERQFLQVATPLLVPGMRASIRGLQSRPELNGHEGVVMEVDDAQEWVKLKMKEGSRKRIRAGNVIPDGLDDATDQPHQSTELAPAAACMSPSALQPLPETKSPPSLSSVSGFAPLAEKSPAFSSFGPSASSNAVQAGAMAPAPSAVPFSGFGGPSAASNAVQADARAPAPDAAVSNAVQASVDVKAGAMAPAPDAVPFSGFGPSAASNAAWASLSGKDQPRQPETISGLIGQKACVRSLQSRPELNGCAAMIIEYVWAEDRYKLQLDAGLRILIKRANFELASASRDGFQRMA
jgi:hypothetical protein